MAFIGRSIETFEMEDIEVYSLVLNGSLRAYPHGFWEGIAGVKTSEKIVKYVFGSLLEWSIKDIKQKVDTKVFHEYKLISMLKSLYEGSMYICLGEIYPELKEWAEDSYETKEHTDFVHRQYTNEELIDILLEKVKEINGIPKAGDMQRPGAMTYNKRFGSWEKSLMKAGLIEDIYRDIDFKKISKDEVIWKLKELFSDKERVLEKEELFEVYPEGVIKEYFGTYNKVEKIIIDEYTKKDLLKILKKKKEKLGRIPSNKDMKFPKAIVFIDKFGSWQNSLDEMEERQ